MFSAKEMQIKCAITSPLWGWLLSNKIQQVLDEDFGKVELWLTGMDVEVASGMEKSEEIAQKWNQIKIFTI